MVVRRYDLELTFHPKNLNGIYKCIGFRSNHLYIYNAGMYVLVYVNFVHLLKKCLN